MSSAPEMDYFRRATKKVLLLPLESESGNMKNVVTIRLHDEYVEMLDNIKIELINRGYDIEDPVLMRTVLLTGIRDVNMKIEKGVAFFEEEAARTKK